MNYWLVKSDPDTYSAEDLKRDTTTNWDGIRNYQARINLNSMKKGDLVLIYHSQSDKDVRAIAKVTKQAFKDATAEDDRWVAVELTFVKELKNYVTLATIKADKMLSEVPLIRHTRLSVMPLSMAEYERIIELSQSK
jgi:predicted RNA-binding protein with PUA-like domain